MSHDTMEATVTRRRSRSRSRESFRPACTAWCRATPEAVHCDTCHQPFADPVTYGWHLSPEPGKHCRSFAQMQALAIIRDNRGVWSLQ